MSDFAGFVTHRPITTRLSGGLAHVYLPDCFFDPALIAKVSSPATGLRTMGPPLQELSKDFAGHCVPGALPTKRQNRAHVGKVAASFRDDLYNAFHVLPSHIDVGNLTGNAVRNFLIWNTYGIDKACIGVTQSNMHGIVTDAGGSFVLGAMSARVINAVIAMDGPPIIDGSLTFVFADLSLKVTFAGRRIVAWVWMPQAPLSENLEWLTDVIESRDGSEQRMRLRNAPRQTFDVEVLAGSEIEQSQIETALYGWHGRSWGMPVWAEQVVVSGPIDAGATGVDVDTTTSDYRSDGLVMLWQSPTVSEVLQIDSVSSGRVSFKLPSTVPFAAGNVLVMPVRTTRIVGEVKRRDRVGTFSSFEASFTVADNADLVGDAKPVQYLGYDVLTDPLLLSGLALERVIERPMIPIDYETGVQVIDVPRGYSTAGYQMRWRAEDRASVWALRRWLHRCAGRLRPFWMSTWRNDISMLGVASATDTSMRIADIGFSRLLYGASTRKHIAIELVDGTRLYRAITGAVSGGAGEEVMSLDSAFGMVITPPDVARISWLSLHRLNGDKVELSFDRVGCANVAVPVKEVAQ